MGYSFASHFSHTSPLPAARAYRQAFRPSERFPAPHMILAVAVICAETEARAEYLASSMDLVWVRLRRGEFAPVPSPDEALAYPYTPLERTVVESYRALAIVGTPGAVRERIEAMVREAGADEVMVTSTIHDPDERLRSFELLAEEFGLRGAKAGTA
jgi:luciferase family oxidoreductase group 1